MNKKRLLILMGTILLLTGCIKYDLNMGVGTDKSFSLTIIDAIQNEYAGVTEGNKTNQEEYEKLGYKVEQYSDSTHTGVKLIKKFNNIDEVSNSDFTTVELTSLLSTDTKDLKLFKSSKNGTISTYTANFTYDLTLKETENNTDNTNNMDYSEYSNTMIFTYTISLPNNSTIISDNADKKSNDGYTLTWNMKYGELKNLNFSFSIDDNDITHIIPDNGKDDNNNSENNNNENDSQVNDNNTTNQNDLLTNDTQNNKFGSFISILFVVVIVLGLLAYKIKAKKDNNTPNAPMSHKQAPKR